MKDLFERLGRKRIPVDPQELALLEQAKRAATSPRSLYIPLKGRKVRVAVGDTIVLDFGWKGLVTGFENWSESGGSAAPGVKVVVQAYNEESFGPDAPRHKKFYKPGDIVGVIDKKGRSKVAAFDALRHCPRCQGILSDIHKYWETCGDCGYEVEYNKWVERESQDAEWAAIPEEDPRLSLWQQRQEKSLADFEQIWGTRTASDAEVFSLWKLLDDTGGQRMASQAPCKGDPPIADQKGNSLQVGDWVRLKLPQHRPATGQLEKHPSKKLIYTTPSGEPCAGSAFVVRDPVTQTVYPFWEEYAVKVKAPKPQQTWSQGPFVISVPLTVTPYKEKLLKALAGVVQRFARQGLKIPKTGIVVMGRGLSDYIPSTGTIRLSVQDLKTLADPALEEALAHELGHLIHFRLMKHPAWTTEKFQEVKAQGWPKEWTPSAYAKTDADEWFAEMVVALVYGKLPQQAKGWLLGGPGGKASSVTPTRKTSQDRLAMLRAAATPEIVRKEWGNAISFHVMGEVVTYEDIGEVRSWGVVGGLNMERITLKAAKVCAKDVAEMLKVVPLKGLYMISKSTLPAELRGKGVGKILYERALAEATKRGCAIVPEACWHNDMTSKDALHVWASLERRHFSVGHVVWGGPVRNATKTHIEKEDEEAERLVRPKPKKKPPRHDLRRERMEMGDPDTDTDGKADTDKDLSLNYKRVAARYLMKLAAGKVQRDKKPKKPGDYWQTESGWGVFPPGSKVPTSAPDEESAKSMAEGGKPGAPKEEGDSGGALTPEDAAKKQKLEEKKQRAKGHAKDKRQLGTLSKYIGQTDAAAAEALGKLTGTKRKEFMQEFRQELDVVKKELLDDDGVMDPSLVEQMTTAFVTFRDGEETLADSDNMAKQLALVRAAREVVANPSMLGGQRLSDKEKSPKEIRKRSEQAVYHYGSLSKELRAEALGQAVDRLKRLPDGNKKVELEAIVDGLALAMSTQGESAVHNGKQVRPEQSPEFNALARSLIKNQTAGPLLGSMKELHGPESRELLQNSLEASEVEDVYAVAGGESGPYGAIIKSMESGDLSPEKMAIARSWLEGMTLDMMSVGHSLLTDAVGAASKGTTDVASGKVSKIMAAARKQVQNDPKVKDAIDKMLECLHKASDEEERKRCRSDHSEAQIAQLAAMVNVAEKASKGKLDPGHPLLAQLRHVVETGDIKELEKRWVREGVSE